MVEHCVSAPPGIPHTECGLILCDDLGYGDEYYGSSIHTPEL
jgi:hypothetical protein